MKIGIFTELFLPHIGGQELHYAELAEALASKGHSVDVYCIRHPDTAPATEHMNGVRVFRYPRSADYTRPVVRLLRRRVLPLVKYSWWCRQVALSANYDCYIYNQWPLAHLLLSPVRARNKALLDWCEVRNNLLFRAIQRFLPLAAARNIAVSTAVAEHISSSSKRKVEYVPSGVNTHLYRNLPLASRHDIVYIGRLKKHKNVPLLIAAFRMMVIAGFSERLVIAGAGSEYEELRAEAQAAGIGDRVEFPGAIPEERKLELLSKGLTLVLPSRREGFPRVIAEAMASGLPVVTVDYPENGAKHIVQQYRCGIVTEPSASDLARGIFQAIESWTTYSLSSLGASKELEWSNIANRIVELADEMQEAHHPANNGCRWCWVCGRWGIYLTR